MRNQTTLINLGADGDQQQSNVYRTKHTDPRSSNACSLRASTETSCWLAVAVRGCWNWFRLDTPKPTPTQDPHVTSDGVSANSLPPHAERHRRGDYSTVGSPYQRLRLHHQTNRLRTDNNNHEPLHPSRILDARANWCVYKSIRQLPLDCNSATTGFRPREVIAQATHTTDIREDKERDCWSQTDSNTEQLRDSARELWIDNSATRSTNKETRFALPLKQPPR